MGLYFLESIDTVCEGLPSEITGITSLIFNAIKIGIPVILIFIGMLDFGKSVMAGKEDEIKGHQKLFIKRLIAAALVFLVLSIVQFLLGIIAADDQAGIMGCINKILGTNK